MNVFINLKCLIEKIHASIARSDHELPFNFTRLNLECALKVHDGLLELILLGVVHTKA
jgi:hypothetical protein